MTRERLTDSAQGYCEIYCDFYTSCFSEPDVCERKYEVQLYDWLKDYESAALREQDKVVDSDQFNRWISVEERLPEHGQKVLGIDSDGEIEVWCFDAEYPSMCRYGGNLRAFDISRWMPLPEPPEEEDT